MPSPREKRRRAAQSARGARQPQPVAPGLERRRPLIEPFRAEHVEIGQVTPEEDAAVDQAQVSLTLIGVPAHVTRTSKIYLTYLTPAIAVQVGQALIDEATPLLARGTTEATDSGLLLAGNMAEASAVAHQLEQTEALRGG